MNSPTTFSCADFDRDLPSYLEGALADAEAERLEAHAAECARCEPLMEAATRRADTFAPALPWTVRDATLNTIAISRVNDAHRIRARWLTGTGVLAAAALLSIFVSRESPVSVVDSARGVREAVVADNPMVRIASQLADDEAKAQFAELDAAASELEIALVTAPNDRELRAYLNSVRARRDELARRVKEAKS